MMGLIIDYAYTRYADVTADNVERLLPAADQFHVLGLVKRCCDFLAVGLDVDNCIGIRNFARTFFCNNLERIANRFASCLGPICHVFYPYIHVHVLRGGSISGRALDLRFAGRGFNSRPVRFYVT